MRSESSAHIHRIRRIVLLKGSPFPARITEPRLVIARKFFCWLLTEPGAEETFRSANTGEFISPNFLSVISPSNFIFKNFLKKISDGWSGWVVDTTRGGLRLSGAPGREAGAPKGSVVHRGTDSGIERFRTATGPAPRSEPCFDVRASVSVTSSEPSAARSFFRSPRDGNSRDPPAVRPDRTRRRGFPRRVSRRPAAQCADRADR